MIGQFENVAGFINKAQYPNQVGVLSSEWGTIGNIRIYLSSRGSVTSNGSLLGNDVYNVFVGGQESYAKIEQNSVSAKFIYHPPGLTKTKTRILDKSPLIDLEAYGENYGDRAQATYECAA